MRTVTPLDSSPNYTRLQMWNNQLTDARATIKLGPEAAEPCLCWRSLNRLRTGIGRAKTTMRRWAYIDNTQSVNCDCCEPQTMPPPLLPATWRALLPGRPHHCHREGDGMCLDVTTPCVNDTSEEVYLFANAMVLWWNKMCTQVSSARIEYFSLLLVYYY